MVQLLNDRGSQSNSTQADGQLANIQGTASGSQLQVTAVDTGAGPMAFALYLPPQDFSRGGDDDNAAQRFVSIQMNSLSVQSYSGTTGIAILRPPVVLVHGLWDNSVAWDHFDSLENDPSSRFFVQRADYSYSPGAISASNPFYSASVLSKAAMSALGFAFNAPLVHREIDNVITNFRLAYQAAAVQADVVAHSMGGTITRTVEGLPEYIGPESFGLGNVHKLITIGTPHLGTPLATQLLQANNSCIRNLLAKKGKLSLSSATVGGSSVSGAVGDLEGDGLGGTLSPALQKIGTSNGHEIPTALISGIMAQGNLSGLNYSAAAAYLRFKCSDPLAQSLTVGGWPNIFRQDSDAIVPLTSQLNNSLGAGFSGLIHSAGVESLGFSGPGELDPDQQTLIPSTVIQLLNAPVSSGAFTPLP